MTTIKARLDGHQHDLETLAELFSEGDPTVAADSDGYFLEFAADDHLIQDGGRLRDAAQAILDQANGAARLATSSFQPVRLTGRFVDDAGRAHAVVLAETAEARVRVGAVAVAIDGVRQPRPLPPSRRALQLAATHSDVAEVLELLGRSDPTPDWYVLYKVNEIVEQSAGGSRQLVRMGWATQAEIDAFGASANHQAISGSQARHARMPGTPGPRRVMTVRQGQDLIMKLVERWTTWLSTSQP